MHKKIAKIFIDTFHNIWIGVFTGGFLSIILEQTGSLGLIIALWGAGMLLVSATLKVLVDMLDE